MNGTPVSSLLRGREDKGYRRKWGHSVKLLPQPMSVPTVLLMSCTPRTSMHKGHWGRLSL